MVDCKMTPEEMIHALNQGVIDAIGDCPDDDIELNYGRETLEYVSTSRQIRDYITATKDRAVSEWQPIETAPKDGTAILLYFPHKDVAIRGCWEWMNEGDWESGIEDWQQWQVDDDLFYIEDFEHENPTHWMPLTDPGNILFASKEVLDATE